MHFTVDEQNEHKFYAEIEVEEGKEYQYKFRVGDGDWWTLNEELPTGRMESSLLCEDSAVSTSEPLWKYS